MRKKIVTALLAGTVAASTFLSPIQAEAAKVTTVTVGTQVEIPTEDIVVGGAITEDQALKERQEFIEENSSNSTEVDSNMDEIVNGYLPNMPGNFEDATQNPHQVTNPTLTQEEFEQIIGNLSQEQQDKYHAALEELKAQNDKEKAEAEEFLKKLYQIYAAEAAGGQDGNGNSGNDAVYGMIDSLLDEFGVDTIDELIDKIHESMMENKQEQIDAEEFGDKVELDGKVLELEGTGEREKLRELYVDIDDSAYKNDTVNPEAHGFADLYICAKCGQVYGEMTHCDCGKTLDYMGDKGHFNVTGSFDENGFLKVDTSEKDGVQFANYSAAYQIDPNGFEGSPYTYGISGMDSSTSYACCRYCRRVISREDVEDFIVMGDDLWACKDCFYNTGEPKGLDDLARDKVTGKWREDYGGVLPYYCYTGHLNETPADSFEGFNVVRHVGIKGLYDDGSKPHVTPEPDPELDALRDMLKELYENVMDQEYSDNWDDITEEQLKAFEDALRNDYEDGVPSADFRGDEEKISESEEYQRFEKEIFGEWNADKQKWTEKQKELYEDIMNQYNSGNFSDLIEDMRQDGVFDHEDAQDRLDALHKFMSQYTSVSDEISTTLVVDYRDGITKISSEEKTVVGLGKAEVYNNSTGERVCYIDPWDTALSSVWLASDIGMYTVKRSVDVYDCTWRLEKTTAHVKWVADDLGIVLYDKEISRVREDSSGTNYRNKRTVKPADALVKVIAGNLDLNNIDYYATERIK